MKNAIAGLTLVLLFAAVPAEAQVCQGAPPFGPAPYQVGVGAAFTDGAQGAGGHFAAGGEALFAGGGVSVLGFDDLDSTQTSVSAFAGADLNVDRNNRVFFCPLASLGFGVGPDVGPVDISTFILEGGGSVGVVARDTGDLMVVPTFGLAAGWQRIDAEAGGVDQEDSDGYGVARVGVGFIFGERIGILPDLAVPFSVADSDVIFTITFAFNFGG